MKKLIITFLLIVLVIFVALFSGCNGNKTEAETTTPETTQKLPGKYAESKYIGAWYNADADNSLICTLNDDGSAVFKDDKNATWEENESGIIITAIVDKKETKMEGYFVIAGEGYVARATDANMHYLNEGGTLQLEIMLTESTCVDCIRK